MKMTLKLNPLMPGDKKGHYYLNKPAACLRMYDLLLPPGNKGLVSIPPSYHL